MLEYYKYFCKGPQMSKKVLIISTSMRKDSNSGILADEFARGAIENGNIVEKIDLNQKQINFCKGCYICPKTHQCIQNDDMNEILNKMCSSEVIVFATPVYHWEMSGQMKTLLDRTLPLFSLYTDSGYKFREIYLIAVAATPEGKYQNLNPTEGIVRGLESWIKDFDWMNPKVSLRGTICGWNALSPAEIKNQTDKLEEAYKMGKSI